MGTTTAPPARPIGARLRAVRLARRLTLTDVAAASRLTKGFLSKLERDQANASVAALIRVCAALDVSPGSLFDAPAGGEVVRAGGYPPIAFGGRGLTEHLLTPPGERRLQAILSEIAPGGGSGKETYSLPADVEFVYVLDGRLEVTVGDDVIVLKTGDAFTFAPTTRHGFRSLRKTSSTRVLWVFTPALAAGRAID